MFHANNMIILKINVSQEASKKLNLIYYLIEVSFDQKEEKVASSSYTRLKFIGI